MFLKALVNFVEDWFYLFSVKQFQNFSITDFMSNCLIVVTVLINSPFIYGFHLAKFLASLGHNVTT